MNNEHHISGPSAAHSIAIERARDKLMGDGHDVRRPLTDYEYFYEVTSAGALYSIRLQRFLKPVYNEEKRALGLVFEHNGQTIKMSPGKAVALSFFTPAQRVRIVDEVYEIKPFYTFQDLKGHAGIERLASKYHVSEGAIFYILISFLSKNGNSIGSPYKS